MEFLPNIFNFMQDGISQKGNLIIKVRNFFIFTIVFSFFSTIFILALMLGYHEIHMRENAEVLFAFLFLFCNLIFYLTPYYLLVLFFKIKNKYKKWILFSIPFYITVCDYYTSVDSYYLLQEGLGSNNIQLFKLLVIYIFGIFLSGLFLGIFERKTCGATNN